MKLRLAVPAVLVDVGRLRELSYVRDGGDHVAIGALTRHRDLETSELLGAQVPILAHVAGLVGDPQVRHRGTIGGSLAHGDPASDLPAVVLALGAWRYEPNRLVNLCECGKPLRVDYDVASAARTPNSKNRFSRKASLLARAFP